jgi:hypothetical protein
MSFMRLARWFLIGLAPIGLTGCLHEADRPAWMNRIPLLGSTPVQDAAGLEYWLIERPAGGDEINRTVWLRIDEQIFPFETRTVLEATGLRVGIASESTPGPLRKMIEDPRTGRGHRLRTFSLDKPSPMLISGVIPHAAFTIPAGEEASTKFAHDDAALGFEVTVRDGPDGKVLVKLVPHARFRDAEHLLPSETGERAVGADHFPAAGFEVALSPSEFLVIGTDSYRDGTFGHEALTGEQDDRPVQRLLVLRAGRTKGGREGPLTGGDSQAVAPPIASQVTAVRGVSP